jgi:hypothetical protein
MAFGLGATFAPLAMMSLDYTMYGTLNKKYVIFATIMLASFSSVWAAVSLVRHNQ